MTLMEYLDTVCEYEGKVYETKLKIKSQKEDIEKYANEVIEKKATFNNTINGKNKKLKELTDEYERTAEFKSDTA